MFMFMYSRDVISSLIDLPDLHGSAPLLVDCANVPATDVIKLHEINFIPVLSYNKASKSYQKITKLLGCAGEPVSNCGGRSHRRIKISPIGCLTVSRVVVVASICQSLVSQSACP